MGTATFFGPPKIETEEVPTAGANPNPIPILIPIPIPNPKPNPNPSPNPNPNPNPSPSPNPNPNQVPTAEAKAAAAVALARTPLLLKFDKEKIYEWQACNRGCRGCNRGCLGGSTRGRCCIPTAPREERQKRSASDASRYQTVLSACTRHALGMHSACSQMSSSCRLQMSRGRTPILTMAVLPMAGGARRGEGRAVGDITP